ncbi:MAG: hypothetical protein JWR26_4807 [Pedosphaera sp.]|nr:hypothetical protein [Pedosphaera sp.]
MPPCTRVPLRKTKSCAGHCQCGGRRNAARSPFCQEKGCQSFGVHRLSSLFIGFHHLFQVCFFLAERLHIIMATPVPGRGSWRGWKGLTVGSLPACGIARYAAAQERCLRTATMREGHRAAFGRHLGAHWADRQPISSALRRPNASVYRAVPRCAAFFSKVLSRLVFGVCMRPPRGHHRERAELALGGQKGAGFSSHGMAWYRLASVGRGFFTSFHMFWGFAQVFPHVSLRTAPAARNPELRGTGIMGMSEGSVESDGSIWATTVTTGEFGL